MIQRLQSARSRYDTNKWDEEEKTRRQLKRNISQNASKYLWSFVEVINWWIILRTLPTPGLLDLRWWFWNNEIGIIWIPKWWFQNWWVHYEKIRKLWLDEQLAWEIVLLNKYFMIISMKSSSNVDYLTPQKVKITIWAFYFFFGFLNSLNIFMVIININIPFATNVFPSSTVYSKESEVRYSKQLVGTLRNIN